MKQSFKQMVGEATKMMGGIKKQDFAINSRATLQKEAPETLVRPKRNQFNTKANYLKALAKFKIKGEWSTPE